MVRHRQLQPVGHDPAVGRFRRWYSRLATTRPALSISRHVGWRIDPVLLRLTRGRLATTLVFPTGVLETTGARSGQQHRNAVIYWRDGQHLIIAASNAGAGHNPSWYHNLLAHPLVRFNGVPAAVVPDDADRDQIWRQGDRTFPAFVTYRERAAAAGRAIPLVRLIER